MIEITAEVRRAYRWATQARDYLHGSATADNMLHLADFARDQLAGRLQDFHNQKHEKRDYTRCFGCRFTYKFSYWQDEAERLLGNDKAPGAGEDKG